MTPKILFAGRIAIFEIGAAVLVAVVVFSMPRPRPVAGFEQIDRDRQRQRRQSFRWADYKPLALRGGAVILVTGALLAGFRTRRR